MRKSLCSTCIHNCTDRKRGSCSDGPGVWCNAEYGRVITKKRKGCKNYKERIK